MFLRVYRFTYPLSGHPWCTTSPAPPTQHLSDKRYAICFEVPFVSNSRLYCTNLPLRISFLIEVLNSFGHYHIPPQPTLPRANYVQDLQPSSFKWQATYPILLNGLANSKLLSCHLQVFFEVIRFLGLYSL